MKTRNKLVRGIFALFVAVLMVTIMPEIDVKAADEVEIVVGNEENQVISFNQESEHSSDVKGDLPKLATPTNVRWGTKYGNIYTLEWDTVENSENFYKVVLCKDGVDVDTIYCDTGYLYSPSITVGLEIEDCGSGTYTAKVYAMGNKSYAGSDYGETDSAFVYTRPDNSLSVPSGVKWDGNKICWNVDRNADGYKLWLYRDGEFVYGVSTQYGGTYAQRDLSEKMTVTGTYTAIIRAVSYDINNVASSAWTEGVDIYVETAIPNYGLAQGADGNWYYYNRGVIDTSYTGLVCDSKVGWWYVQNGVVNFGYTGLVCDNVYGWWYIQGGAVAFGYSGFVYDANVGWWLVENGAISFGFNGLYCDANCGWWLVQNGTINFGYSGLYFDANYGWWLVQGGTINFGYTGLAYDPYVGWWYVTGGAINFGYTGPVEYNGGVFNVVNGMVVF